MLVRYWEAISEWENSDVALGVIADVWNAHPSFFPGLGEIKLIYLAEVKRIASRPSTSLQLTECSPDYEAGRERVAEIIKGLVS